MADWRQIQARIRKAKASADAAAKLAELYERTRDAMVAFELAQWQEKAGEHAEAARWYTAAAERFRRSQWRTKAEAALARLRNPASASEEAAADSNPEPSLERASAPEPDQSDGPSESPIPRSTPSSMAGSAQVDVAVEDVSHAGEAEAKLVSERPADRQDVPTRHRRRGRRGGRNRRRGQGRTGETASAMPQSPATLQSTAEPIPVQPPPSSDEAARVPAQTPPASAERVADATVSSVAVWRERSRAGEPALASRMAQLESQLRRLLACPPVKLGQAESAPAGPGVLLLSDSEQVTHYYVETCQTLRIAIGNLIRGGRGGKDIPQLKQTLAENLGIPESRVTGYLKDHCSVRWLQLDEGASELAHFAIAVLRPVVNR
jgi:hypothetical protein